jgi:hypothetical protein
MHTVCVYTALLGASSVLSQRCVESAAKFGVDVSRCKSVHWDQIQPAADAMGLRLRLKPWQERESTKTHCPAFRLANGLTHYGLYLSCVERGESICILEHDAVFVAPLPETVPDGITQVSSHRDGQMSGESLSSGVASGRHSFAGQALVLSKGIIPHPLTKTAGTSGYIITPDAAQKMVNHIQQHGVAFADCLHRDVTGPLWLAVPQPIECKVSIIPLCYYTHRSKK